ILESRPAPARGEGRGIENAPLRTADAWLEILGRQRRTLFERVRAAEPAARLDVTIEHPFFGPLNWRETLLFTRLHDLDHAGQLGKIAVAFGATPPPGASPRCTSRSRCRWRPRPWRGAARRSWRSHDSA